MSYIQDKNRVRDYGQNINLQQRPSFDSYYRNNKKYYSGIDGEIYFKDTYIDEVFSLEYRLMQETKPIFGYNSYTYDEMSTGSRVVTGSFAINYTEANFLGKVLNAFKDKTKIIAGSERRLNTINNYVRREDSSLDPTITTSKYPKWDQQFEILIAHGEKNRKIFGGRKDNIEILKGVQLTGVQTSMDALGSPVMEIYQFIARDITYGDQKRVIGDESVFLDKDKQEIDNKDIVYKGSSYYNIVDTTYDDSSYNDNSKEVRVHLDYSITRDDVESIMIVPNHNMNGLRVRVKDKNNSDLDTRDGIKFAIRDLLDKKDYKIGDPIYCDIVITFRNGEQESVQDILTEYRE